MSIAFLNPLVPALESAEWQLQRVPPLVTVQNGVRINEDQLARVRRARLAMEHGGGATAAAVVSASHAGPNSSAVAVPESAEGGR